MEKERFIYNFVYTDKWHDDVNAFYRGVYHDPEKRLAVASDQHALMTSAELYNKNMAGKVVTLRGDVLECNNIPKYTIMEETYFPGAVPFTFPKDFEKNVYERNKAYIDLDVQYVNKTTQTFDGFEMCVDNYHAQLICETGLDGWLIDKTHIMLMKLLADGTSYYIQLGFYDDAM